MQNACANAVVALVGLKSEAKICLNRVHTVLLEFVRAHLVHQADATPLLVKIHYHAFAFLLYHLHCLVELRSTITTVRTEDVASGARRMHTHENRLVLLPFALYNSHKLQPIRLLQERDQSEMSILRRHIHFFAFFHNRLLLQAISHQVVD